MKKIVLLVSLLSTQIALAQESRTKISTDGLQGIRVSIVKPFLKVNNYSLDNVLGVSVGYAKLPIQQIGFTTNLALLQIQERGSTVNMYRVDGNIGTSMNEQINFKGGLNISNFTSDPGNFSVSPSVGMQLSVGAKINEIFGVDLAYTKMAQTASAFGNSVEVSESGLELGFHGTF